MALGGITPKQKVAMAAWWALLIAPVINGGNTKEL